MEKGAKQRLHPTFRRMFRLRTCEKTNMLSVFFKMSLLNMINFLPCWSFPMRPCLFTKHFVSFQARFICLPEGIACPPHSDILQKTQIPDLMTYQSLVEDVCCFFIIRFDTPKRLQKILSFKLCLLWIYLSVFYKVSYIFIQW